MMRVLLGTAILSALALSLSGQLHPFPGPGVRAVGGAGPAFVSYSGATDDASSTTITTSGSLTIGTGDCLVCVAMGLANTVSGITCGGSNAFVAVRTDPQHYVDGYAVELWYKTNAVSGTTTCTATFNSAVTYRRIGCVNFSGLAANGVLDQNSCNDAGCTATSSHATVRTATDVTTTAASEVLVFTSAEYDTHTYAGANGYTVLSPASGVDYSYAYKIVSSTGSHPNGTVVTVNDATYDTYISGFATFR